MTDAEWGAWLRTVRKQRFRLDQTAFADGCHVTQPTVSRWESGDIEACRTSLAAIIDFARKRGVRLSAEELIGRAA